MSDADAVPKHRDISRQLLAEILAGKYQATDRLPSEAQLVKRFGVSRPTAARALRDLQDEGLIERRAGSGTYLREQAKPASLRQLGLLVPERGTTEIFEQICGELSSLARAHDYALLFGGAALAPGEADASREHARAVCDRFVEQRVAGVFFAPFETVADREEVNRDLTERLRGAGIPLVLLDRDVVGFPRRSSFDLVSIDNFAGGFLIAEHLLKLGCKRPVFLARPGSAPTIDARIAGMREALDRVGRAWAREWVLLGDPEKPGWVRARIADGSCDAVVCANDLTAAQLLRTLEGLHVRVPRDLRVAGFDDVPYAALLTPALTTMHQPCRDLAVTAFRALAERMADPALPTRTLMLAPRLVVRESCGAYLPGGG